MAAYGLDISQILGWTFPQLLLFNRRRKQRERHERRFQLMLVSGTLPPKTFDGLWQSLGGVPIDLDAVASATPDPAPTPTASGRQAHGVDAKGNVLAPGAPLLSDIALGKVPAPLVLGRPFPITTVGRNKENEEPHG